MGTRGSGKVTWTWIQTELHNPPGGPVVKNPPTDGEDMGSIPGTGRFHMPLDNYAHVPQSLSPFAAITEAHTP